MLQMHAWKVDGMNVLMKHNIDVSFSRSVTSLHTRLIQSTESLITKTVKTLNKQLYFTLKIKSYGGGACHSLESDACQILKNQSLIFLYSN